MEFIETPPKLNYLDLRAKLFALMKDENYAFHSINTYRKIYNLLEIFLASRNIKDYSPQIGQEFLCNCEKYRGKVINGKRVETDNVLTFIKTLDNIIFFGKLRVDLQDKRFYCPDCYSDVLKNYLNFLQSRQYNKCTIESHYRYVSEFLSAVSLICSDINDWQCSDLYPILEHFASKGNALYCISSFLKFAFKYSYTKTDFSRLIQYPRREQKIPSVYTKQEISRMFQCIDRSTIKGKRDYAMILLAYRLGLRISDIVSLTLENIDFNNNKISLIQQKTGVPLSLPLLKEIREAVTEYLDVRPCSQSKEIFLRSRAPYTSLGRTSITSALHKYFNKSSVDVAGRNCGCHSLRATLASELIAENVSFAITQKILGHTDSSAIQHYVKLDVETLRKFALSVPCPSGNFEKFLNTSEDQYE